MFDVLPLTMGDTHLFRAIKALADETLGKDYLTDQDIAAFCEDPDKKIWIGRKASVIPSALARRGSKKIEEIIGFGTAGIVAQQEAEAIWRSFGKNFPEGENKRIGWLRSAGVKLTHRGQGLGKTFVEKQLAWCKAEGCREVFAISWRQAEKNSATLLKRLDFTELAACERYYEQESLRQNYSCPTCGQPPCLCGASLFARTLG